MLYLDGWVASLCSDTTVVVTVSGHLDVSFLAPSGTPTVTNEKNIIMINSIKDSLITEEINSINDSLITEEINNIKDRLITEEIYSINTLRNSFSFNRSMYSLFLHYLFFTSQ